jgi:hypothetical protein
MDISIFSEFASVTHSIDSMTCFNQCMLSMVFITHTQSLSYTIHVDTGYVIENTKEDHRVSVSKPGRPSVLVMGK